MHTIAAVDLFCGIGGLTHGFVKEKIPVMVGYDIDDSCRYAYTKNNKTKFICKPIEKTSSLEVLRHYPKKSIKILMGCAPCQPFSKYNITKKKGNSMDLLDEFSRIIEGVNPEIVTMENVPRLVKYDIFQNFVDNLKRKKFDVNYYIVKCKEYGIPQVRRRLVLLASRMGEIDLINGDKNNIKTVRSFIGDLEPIGPGEVSKSDHSHRSRDMSPLNKERIKLTPPGGSWIDWPEKYINECHKKESGKSFSSIYGRMSWDKPAPTITTQFHGFGNGRFGHPEQNRAMSYREAALLQTFPKNYKIFDPSIPFIGDKISKHIGNAVPVKLGRVIAKSIKIHISNAS